MCEKIFLFDSGICFLSLSNNLINQNSEYIFIESNYRKNLDSITKYLKNKINIKSKTFDYLIN
jgi:hypothetical protein